MVRDIVQVDGRCILLQELEALDSDLVELLIIVAALFKLEHAVFLVWLVLLRQDNLLKRNRPRVVKIEMRLIQASSRCLHCRRLVIEHRVVIDHVELHGSEPDRLEYLLHPDTPKKALEELARGTIAEHDLLLLLDAAHPAEDEQAFVHAVEQFDVLFV